MISDEVVPCDCDCDELEAQGWASLPTVALVEIFKNLQSRKDRLAASSVCKTWRPPAFQLPLSHDQGLTLDLTRRSDLEKATFLREAFICKAPHIQLIFDLEMNEDRRAFLLVSLALLTGNAGLKSLKLTLAKGRGYGEEFNGGFLLKLVKSFVQVVKGKALLDTVSFPLIGRWAGECEALLLLGLRESRSRYSLQGLFLPRHSFKDKLHVLRAQGQEGQELGPSPLHRGIPSFCRLQFLTLSHDSLNDSILSLLGQGNLSGGLKRLSLLADRRNSELSNGGWTAFVGNNPLCTVHLTVFGGSGLLSHSSNLIFPALPLSHFRAFHSRDLKVNFLNALVGWNLTSLEHLELVDYDCSWDEALMQMDPEENQFLDPIVYAAWRCKQLHTIKLGIRYCGDSLVGIARLKGPSLLHLEIPKSCVTCNSLNIKPLIREVTKALGRPWKPVDNARSRNMRKLRRSSLSTSPWLELLQANEV